jgi:Histidine kinase-, DNA gyrase B-, and HSP90-like ATPase
LKAAAEGQTSCENLMTAASSLAVTASVVQPVRPVQCDPPACPARDPSCFLNAVEAMSATSEGQRELLISIGKAETDDIVVTMRDSGPGLPPSGVDRLFEAFYTTRADGGLGCRSVVRSFRRMAEDCGRARTCPAAPPFNSRCPPRTLTYAAREAAPHKYILRAN